MYGGMVSSQPSGEKQNRKSQNSSYIPNDKPRSLYRRFLNFFRETWTGVRFKEDSDYEDAETSPNYRPTGILALCKKTKFNETEIKRIYRGFKSECPSGTVDEDSFKDIYCRMFPQGANASQYAHYVFHSLDQDQTGVLNFEDFVLALSTLARGDLEEKVKWVFTLYDLNGDGFITRKELADVAVSVFELMGKYVHPPLDGNDISLRVDAQFDKMDKNKDGVVTWEEFLAFFTQEDVSLSLNYLETIM